MQKWSSKSESTWKTEQDKSCWKFFDWSKSTVNSQSQRSTIWSKSMVNGWRVLTWQCGITLGLTWQYVKQNRRVGACERHWRCVGARVMYFLAVLGWVFLGIGCSVTLYLYFGSWMSRTMISESCRDCGRDGDDSLLSVTTGGRQGQRKNVGDVHRNQKVRGIALIPC